MILSFTYQCRLFLVTIALGLLFALIYHIIYVLIKTIGANKLLKGIYDVIYWAVYAVTLFLIMLKLNSGEVRPFAVLGSALGMIFYYTMVKSFMDRLMYPVFHGVKKVLLLIFNIIATPIRLVLYPIVRIFNRLSLFAKKYLKKYVKYEKIIARQKGKKQRE